MSELERLQRALDYISTAGEELYPVGPSETVYEVDGNTVIENKAPWHFLHGKGPTFLEAVEDAMQKDGNV